MQNLLIFDFDGVIADSEVLANTVLAEMVSELGVPTTLEDSYARYMGKRFDEVMAAVAETIGAPLPEDFPERFQARGLERFRGDLEPVPGALEFINDFAATPQCIASASSPARLQVCLEVLDLTASFGANVYSAAQVARGKPHPDIFLHAAAEMNVPPAHCLVIEDSASGVQGARAAGMTVIGMLAASHILGNHADRLLDAGADHVTETFAAAAVITREFLAS